MFLPYSLLISITLIITTSFLDVGKLRAVVSLLGAFAVLYLWVIDRKRVDVSPTVNGSYARFRQSVSTIGSYDKGYTDWLGSRTGQSIVMSITQPVCALALFADCVGVTFYDQALISFRGAFHMALSLIGFGVGIGF